MQPAKMISAIRDFRDDFPLIKNQPIHYLDSAATTQKPQRVIDAMVRCLENDYANVHRGIYSVAARATAAHAAARQTVASFINATRCEELIFTSGATDSINLVAATWGRANLQAGDEIVLTALEHHANIVPWLQLAQERGCTIKVAPLEADGQVTVDSVARQMTDRTKLIACAHVSNVLGTVLPVADICALARVKGIVTLIDGCQAVAHRPVDVQAIGCDFYVFSAHKLYGPTGIGALYGRYALLAEMPPYQTGGDMIEQVSFSTASFKAPPARFEAGTPAIIEAIGFANAVNYVRGIGFDAIMAHETMLLEAATAQLRQIDGLTIHGTAPGKEAIICFSIAGVQAYDLATICDQMGVCIRAGQHCAEPLHEALGVTTTARASFAIYSTMNDVTALVQAVRKAKEMLS